MSAANGTSDDEARCGGDQRPVYGDPQVDPDDGMVHGVLPTPDADGVVRHLPGEIKPAGVGYTGAMRRIDAALRSSGDPFDRAVADKLDLPLVTPPAMRTEALVQDALASNDARVYALAWAACHSRLDGISGVAAPSAGCARLSAGQWAQLDPGDAQPWLWALTAANERGDAPAQREALARIAESSHLNVRFQAGMAAVARLRLADADLAAQWDAAAQALEVGPPPASLVARCRDHAGDTDLAATCDRIAAMLYDHADSLIWHTVGGALHKQATGDPSWLDRVHREQRLRSSAAAAATPDDGKPCGVLRDGLRYFVRLGTVGELRLAQEAMHAASAP